MATAKKTATKTATRAKTITKKATEPKKHYIVTFDIDDSDPVAVFDTLEKAKKFVTALVEQNDDVVDECIGYHGWDVSDVQRDSIKLYEGILIGKPKVVITFTK